MHLQLPKVEFDKNTLRLMIVGIVIGFIVSQWFWAGRLFASFFNFPELRHNIVVNPRSLPDGASEAQLTVVNLGFGPAQNVLIHVNTRGCCIDSYQIDAQEMYEIKSYDSKQGVINLWLDRLASNARVEIAIKGRTLSQDQISLSATSNQGASVPIDQQTLSEQARGLSSSIQNVFQDAFQIVTTSEPVRQLTQTLFAEPSIARIQQIVQTRSFQTVALAILVVALIVGLFFTRYFIVFSFFGAWLLNWLFLDLKIATNYCLILPLGVVAVFVCLVVLEKLWLVALTIAISALALWWFEYSTISANFIFAFVVVVFIANRVLSTST